MANVVLLEIFGGFLSAAILTQINLQAGIKESGKCLS